MILTKLFILLIGGKVIKKFSLALSLIFFDTKILFILTYIPLSQTLSELKFEFFMNIHKLKCPWLNLIYLFEYLTDNSLIFNTIK